MPLKKKKKKTRPLGAVVKDTQIIVNRYIRSRDSLKTTGSLDYCMCISCGKVKEFAEIQAGHYVAVGQSSLLRFNEENINGQCSGCNCWGHGMLAEYTINIDKKYGKDTALMLLNKKHIDKKWSRAELLEIQDTYRQKLNDLINFN